MKIKNNNKHKKKLAEKIVNFFGGIFTFFLGNDKSIKVIYIFYFYLIAWQASLKLRESTHSFLLDALSFVIVAILLLLAAFILLKIRGTRSYDGRPIFGDMGGPAKRLINKVDEAHQYLNVELDEKDKQFNERFREKMKQKYEERLKKRYFKEEENTGFISQRIIRYILEENSLDDSKWQEKWNEILKTKLKKITFGDIFGAHFVSFQATMAYFQRSGSYIFGMFALGNIFILWLTFKYVNAQMAYLSLLRYEVLLGIIAALFWTILGMYKFGSMHLEAELFPDEYHETSFQKIEIEPSFYKVIRNYEIVRILLFYLTYIPIYFVASACSLALIPIMDGPLSDKLIEWHIEYFKNILLGNFILVLVYYFISIVVQNCRILVAGLVGALISFFVPHAVYFLIIGKLYSSKDWLSVNSISWMLIGAFSAIMSQEIIKQFKKDK